MTDKTNTEDSEILASFLDFGFDDRILDGLSAMGFEQPTPIQSEAIPFLLEGRDIIGRARTGSGKTAAFSLPLLERIKDGGSKPRALVLSPTRELAIQIGEAIRDHAAHLPQVHGITIYGGAPYPPQIKALKKGCSVVVGTPGRVIDLMEQGALDLSEIELFVLDEADEMLRMGFIEDVERLGETPPNRQVALFSATMPTPIRRVASRTLQDPVEVQVEERALSVDHIDQRWLTVPQSHKLEALCRILQGTQRGATLVFAKTRASCMDVADAMAKRGFAADALHGELGQAARERVLRRFRNDQLLIATDVAVSLDVDHLSHVINLDLPNNKKATFTGLVAQEGRQIGRRHQSGHPNQTRFLRRLEHSLGITMTRVQVPSDAQIAELQRSHWPNKSVKARPYHPMRNVG